MKAHNKTAMTEEQKIAYLAEKVLGWKKTGADILPYWGRPSGGLEKAWVWNPLQDWNHWRQVEEKIVENQNLLEAFISALGTPVNATPYVATGFLLAVGLKTRVDALISAHQSLHDA